MKSAPWQDGRWILCSVKETNQSVQKNTWQSNGVCIYDWTAHTHTVELLHASANIDHISAKCMLGQARAIINNKKVAAIADQPATVKVHPLKPAEGLLYCFNCSGPNHLARHCQLEWPEQRGKPHVRCYKCPGNGKKGGVWVPPLPHIMHNLAYQWCVCASIEWCVVHWLIRNALAPLWKVQFVAHGMDGRRMYWQLMENI